MECILQTPQIQLHEIANHIFNASVSAFSPQTLCRAMYRLGITRKKVSRSQEAKIYSFTLGIKCSEFGQLERNNFFSTARVFLGRLVPKLFLKKCVILIPLRGTAGYL